MKRFLSFSFSLVLLFFAGLVFAETLTNDSIIKMHKAGLPDSVIIAKIESSQANFNTSVDALVDLSRRGVSGDVVAAMTRAADESPKAAPTQQVVHTGKLVVGAAATPQANAPAEFNSEYCPGPGIFLENGGSFVEVEPSGYTASKTSGLWKSKLTYGIMSTKSRAVLQGIRSHNKVISSSPTFYFCFEETQTGLSYETSGATTPSQFVLAKLDTKQKKGMRTLVTGKWNAYTGAYSGPPPNYQASFSFDKLAPGVYKVTTGYLEPGEYCFFYTGSSSSILASTYGLVQQGASGGKVFDFSVG